MPDQRDPAPPIHQSGEVEPLPTGRASRPEDKGRSAVALLQDSALVLVGHGSTKNAESGQPVALHAEALRKRGLTEVHAAYWKQDPRLETVLRNTAAPRVLVVPLFVSEGYFSERVLPQALGLALETGENASRVRAIESSGQVLAYCRPVGTHPGMTAVLLARAREVLQQHPFPHAPHPSKVSLFLAGHGTGQDPNSRAAIEKQVGLISAMNLFASVRAVYIEESPRIGECYDLAPTPDIVVVPFFVSEGMHTAEDLPVMLGEPESRVRQRLALGQSTWRNPTGRSGKRLWLSGVAGTHPGVSEAILDRALEGRNWLAADAKQDRRKKAEH